MEYTYAKIFDRVKAAVIDGIVIIGLMYSASQMLNGFDAVEIYIRVLIFVFIFLIYEPVLVSFFGATVGHFFSNIMVKQERNHSKNINIFRAIPRFIVKYILGWISLLTVNGNEKKQALHDFVGGSVVLGFKSSKIKKTKSITEYCN
ncbi:MAG: RDD family protein [Algibacter sp.]